MQTEVLDGIEVFSSVSEKDREVIAAFAQETHVPEGTTLVKEGQASYELFAIIEGEADVTRDGRLVNELGPGDSFGEIGLLTRSMRTATVVSKTPMRLVTLTRWDVRRLSPAVLSELRDQLGQRLMVDVEHGGAAR